MGRNCAVVLTSSCCFHKSNEVWTYKPKSHGIKCKKARVLVISPGGGARQVGDGDGFLHKVSPAVQKTEDFVASYHSQVPFGFFPDAFLPPVTAPTW